MPTKTEDRVPEDDFLARWSRRKRQVDSEEPTSQPEHQVPVVGNETAERLPTDADMPPVDSLTEESDYSGFLSPRVSEELRKLALRKLFRSAAFNVRDGLDDYDDDFTDFAKLGDIVTAEMRRRLELEERRCRESSAADDLDGPAGKGVPERIAGRKDSGDAVTDDGAQGVEATGDPDLSKQDADRIEGPKT